MYTITELNSKTQPELKVIAESMGLKADDSEAFDDLVYKILDQQAIDSAKNQANTPKKKSAKSTKAKKQPAEKKADEQKADTGKENAPSADAPKSPAKKNATKKQAKNAVETESKAADT